MGAHISTESHTLSATEVKAELRTHLFWISVMIITATLFLVSLTDDSKPDYMKRKYITTFNQLENVTQLLQKQQKLMVEQADRLNSRMDSLDQNMGDIREMLATMRVDMREQFGTKAGFGAAGSDTDSTGMRTPASTVDGVFPDGFPDGFPGNLENSYRGDFY
ncbi:hypothetical protein P153DRAFT_364841 [Dothidotthia symphoricarpi CBS 119687]|uniref:Uncharacterized protein n=1 Tax=Dothidotthia symphoricarpi CBS 119687 TaxID=1392245 RepID=A0A6A6ANH7_9PLEO|nr:uncharacterized protein P153DRAFT_364841 [Dothidotthia symphoricarpi CBS 119687]KAF2132447.1 hypothetical protein P153DRAFT_364841 [Dothidotthia symphoricarpi CBS 119687]